MKARSILTAVLALAVVVFAGAYLGSPWVAAFQLMQAARERDVTALESHIDLPAVRASLKGQIDDRMERSIAKRARHDDPLAQLGVMFGAALIDKTVDAAVTPEAIAEAMRTARVPNPRKSAAPPPDEDSVDAADPAPASSPKVKVALGMAGLNRFDMRLSPADEPDRHLTLILRRRGLFDWKLTDVQLPR